MADEVQVDWLAQMLMQQQDQAYMKFRMIRPGSYRVSSIPSHIRLNNPDAYTPKFIAIGPYHCKDINLHPADKLKMAYLHSLISRSHPETSLHLGVIQEYVRAVAARAQEARDFYSEDIDLDSEQFVSMLVLDGCFIIEHLVNNFSNGVEPELNATPFGPAQLALDLVLLENQIPFFVLAELFTRTKLPALHPDGYPPVGLLTKLAVSYLAGANIARDITGILSNADNIFHLLHLLHVTAIMAHRRWEFTEKMKEEPVLHAVQMAGRMLKRLPLLLLVPLLYPILPEERRWRASYGREDVPCASDMKRMSIKFRKVQDSNNWSGIAGLIGCPPLAVRMEEDTLDMPVMCFEFRTSPLLLNMMALEQSMPAAPRDCSSYVSFMAKLVQSAEDAGVLVAAQVLHINSERKEQIATFFKQLGAASVAELETSYMSGMLEKVRERSSHPLYMMWADVQRNYFTVPWAVVAEFVTFVTFVSTMLQTYASFKK